MKSQKSFIYTAIIKGANVQVKAYDKDAAFDYLKSLDNSLTPEQVHKTSFTNSHQAVCTSNH